MTNEPDLTAVFEEARRLGFLGPGPVGDQISHADGIAALLEAEAGGPAAFLDLGTGGGIPGLVLAGRWPEHPAALLDSSRRRTAFLRRAVAGLGWSGRVVILEGRAEVLARDPELRASFPLVVARSFAAPAVTGEIGGVFVSTGGWLAVSEPNADGANMEADSPVRAVAGPRWPSAGLAELGLAEAKVVQGAAARVALIRRTAPVTERFPRAVGIPAIRPLW